MISWLKKYGLTILKDVAIVLGLAGPAVGAFASQSGSSTGAQVAQTVDTLGQIGNLITTIEAAFAAAFGTTAKTGAAKLQAIQPQVQQLIQEWFAAHFPGTAKVGNQALFAQGCQEISQGMVDLLNSIESNPATTQPVSTAGAPAPAPAPQPVPAVVPKGS